MNKFCQQNSIIHETSLPYLPQQNSIAKRAIAIIFEIAKCMLHFASLSLKYWEEAFLYATHIQSLLLTSRLDSVTNFIRPYFHQLFNDSHVLNGYRNPSKKTFD